MPSVESIATHCDTEDWSLEKQRCPARFRHEGTLLPGRLTISGECDNDRERKVVAFVPDLHDEPLRSLNGLKMVNRIYVPTSCECPCGAGEVLWKTTATQHHNLARLSATKYFDVPVCYSCDLFVALCHDKHGVSVRCTSTSNSWRPISAHEE